MAKKPKNQQNLQISIVNSTPTTIVNWRDQLFSWRQKPVGEAFIYNFCNEMITFFMDNTNVYTIESFLVRKVLDWMTYYRWCKKYPDLQQTHNFILLLLGNRREEGALLFNLNAQTVHIVQPHYSQVWKEMVEWHAEIKAKVSAANDTGGAEEYIIKKKKKERPIELDEAPNTEAVRIKKEADEHRSNNQITTV